MNGPKIYFTIPLFGGIPITQTTPPAFATAETVNPKPNISIVNVFIITSLIYFAEFKLRSYLECTTNFKLD